jgi:hypothetical protein
MTSRPTGFPGGPFLVCRAWGEGTAQLPPLLSNIMFEELDRELRRRVHRSMGYTRDIRVFVCGERTAHRVLGSGRRCGRGAVETKVNQEKFSNPGRPEGDHTYEGTAAETDRAELARVDALQIVTLKPVHHRMTGTRPDDPGNRLRVLDERCADG